MSIPKNALLVEPVGQEIPQKIYFTWIKESENNGDC